MGILDRNQMGVVEEKKESGRKNNMFKLMIIASLIGGVQGCREKDEPKIKKEDHKTIVLWNLNSLPESVAVDTVKNVITVPYEMTEKEIKRMIEKIVTVKDADAKQPSDVGIKTISINEEKGKIIITCFGVNGEDGKDNQTTETYELKRSKKKVDSPTTYVFPEKTLPGVEVDKENKIIKYSPKYTAIDIKEWVEQGTAEDPNGGAEVKGGEIVQEGENKVLKIILSGRNGKTGKDITTEEKFTLKKGEVVAEFPDFLPGTKNNRIVAGDEDFFTTLFQTEISLNTGEKQSIEEVTVNGQKIIQTDNHIIHVPKTYEIVVKIKGKDGKIIEKIYQLIVEKEKIVTNDLSGYTDVLGPEFVNLYPQQQEVLQEMRIPGLMNILKKVLSPCEKKVTVLESGETSGHIFAKNGRKIVKGIDGISYNLIQPEDFGGNENSQQFRDLMHSKISEFTQRGDFLFFELNCAGRGYPSNSTNFWNVFGNNKRCYLSTFESLKREYEQLSLDTHASKVSLPVIKENGKRYFVLSVSRPDIESDPFANDIDAPLIAGIDFGSSSGAAVANAATWALGVQLLQRLGYVVDQQFWDSIFTDSKYDHLFDPVYWVDAKGKIGPKGKEYIKGKVLIRDRFIKHFNVFGLNTEEIKKLKPGETVPLIKYHKKISDYSYIHFGSDLGIVWINGVPYLSYDKLLHQGIRSENIQGFLQNFDVDILIGDKQKKEVYWKSW